MGQIECLGGGQTVTIEQVLNDIAALSPGDQLRVVQAIGDRLPEGVGTELSAAQRAEFDRRWADYNADPSAALTEDEFRGRIRIARRR
ncbi:MAG: addiction module protein [Pirellulales bacterium]